MTYLLLIYSDEADRPTDDASREAYLQRYRQFTANIIETGEFKAGDALHPVSTATSVRIRDGKRLLSDGPFAETREQLGGYYLIEAENLDRAVEIAAAIPTAEHGTIEVRPIVQWDS